MSSLCYADGFQCGALKQFYVELTYTGGLVGSCSVLQGSQWPEEAYQLSCSGGGDMGLKTKLAHFKILFAHMTVSQGREDNMKVVQLEARSNFDGHLQVP